MDGRENRKGNNVKEGGREFGEATNWNELETLGARKEGETEGETEQVNKSVAAEEKKKRK